jgi:hypothetical protein
VISVGLFIGGSIVPLNIRDHSCLIGETAMTVWFDMYGIPMDRLEEGMALVRLGAAEQLEQIPEYEMPPASVEPVQRGVQYAQEGAVSGEEFKEGEVRDFKAIVRATVLLVKATAIASFIYTPTEKARM